MAQEEVFEFCGIKFKTKPKEEPVYFLVPPDFIREILRDVGLVHKKWPDNEFGMITTA
jgi:hypothetical protein